MSKGESLRWRQLIFVDFLVLVVWGEWPISLAESRPFLLDTLGPIFEVALIFMALYYLCV